MTNSQKQNSGNSDNGGNAKNWRAVLASNLIIFTLLTSIFVGAIYSSSSSFYHVAYAQESDDDDDNDTQLLVLMVNFERIKVQLKLAEESLSAGNSDMAFAHAFIPHTTTFPSIKDQLKSIDESSETGLEAILTDLPIKIKEKGYSASSLQQDVDKAEGLMDSLLLKAAGGDSQMLSDKVIVSQTTVFLLRDALQSYGISGSDPTNPQQQSTQFSQVDYENTKGLISQAKSNYLKISGSLDEDGSSEINTFFTELQSSVDSKSSVQSVTQLVNAIERDLADALSSGEGSTATGSQLDTYFSTIRTLLSQAVADVRDGKYDDAEESVVTAYLNNFEYLEPPIEKHDPQLKGDIEIAMREDLRDMIKSHQSYSDISSFVDGIFAKLDKAQDILKSDPSFSNNNDSASGDALSNDKFADIEALSKGFGTYTGGRRAMGEAGDAAKAEVRANVDQIRLKLDKVLALYKEGDSDSALLTSRSAYLDSYENIEIPLRPIDPDFTLEMEIKFAELRNLIQSGQPYEQVEGKIVEIRKGLDESERLVSGVGIVAPAIAFSSSFSIIFREGLESALIVGAILTYLEASRNQKFNKHVYYGIVLAVVATAITWFVAEFIIEVSGASREMIEAIAGISAVAVLFWVSFWILNKVETKKWIEFVKAKVWKATATGSVMVFVMLSFFTVYREGFETVLFYQAMLSFAKYMEWYVAAGLVLGLAMVVGIVFIIRKLGKKLPLRVLFGLTMGVGAYMSIAFMGNAVREFQEVGYLPITHMLGIIPRLDIDVAEMTGIHPTLETVVAQLVLLAVYATGSLYVLVLQPRRKRLIETSRKSRADLVKSDAERSSSSIEGRRDSSGEVPDRRATD